MAVYYNDADAAACAWLRELIAAGLLPAGDVDERSILEVEPADLHGFAQCHFFAGIGGCPWLASTVWKPRLPSVTCAPCLYFCAWCHAT